MIAILLIAFGSCLTEVSDSIGKNEVGHGRQSLFMMGFLQLVAGAFIFLLLILVKPALFVFSWFSLPTFIARAILEVILAHITILAVTTADRSTFSFIRLGTVPLLLVADIILGFHLRPTQLFGLLLLLVTLLLVFVNPAISKKGVGWVGASTLMAAVTIALYKYDISHFNSVLAEQFITYLIVLGYFFVRACWHDSQHFFRLFSKPLYLLQAAAQGLGGVAESYAYSLAPASVILAAKRSTAVMWAIGSGSLYFREKHILVKLSVFILLVGGLILLAL
ncbi:MAG: hypothetical protein HY983_00995 [Candidatus Magasanikbacteria bacterium]|nr:hypothetical protein [Candidatus Magasanikbacteria bacterium]